MLRPITVPAFPTLPVLRHAVLTPASVAALVLIVLTLRLPEWLVRAEFFADDGYLYGLALSNGPVTILQPHAGFLLVGQRAVVYLETLIPPPLAPLLGAMVAISVLTCAATLAASRRMAWDRRSGAMIAIGISLIPAAYPISGNLAHVIWPMMLWMALTAISAEPRWRRAESTVLVVAGLTGPGALILWPLFLSGPRRRLVIVGTAAAVQAVVIVLGDRSSLLSLDLTMVPYVFLMRGIVTPLLGPSVATAIGPMAAIAVGGLLLGCVGVLLMRCVPKRRSIVYLLIAVPAAGVLMAGVPTGWYANTDLFPRYFWIPSAMLVIVIVLGRRHFAAVPLIAALAIGIVSEARIEAWDDMQWSRQSGCIGGPVACEVRVAPSDDWNVRWEPPISTTTVDR